MTFTSAEIYDLSYIDRGQRAVGLLAVLGSDLSGDVANVPKSRSLLTKTLISEQNTPPPACSARRMRIAFDAILGGRAPGRRNVGAIWNEHGDMLA